MAVNDKLNEQYKEQLKSVQALERFTKNITSQQKVQLSAEKAKLATIEKRIKVEEAYFDSFDSFSRKYSSLNKDTQKQIQGTAKGATNLIGIAQQIANEKAREVKYADSTTKFGKQQRQNVETRLSVLGDISTNQIQQAKATQDAEDNLRGTTKLQKDLRDLEAQKGSLTKVQYDLAKKNIKQTDTLKQKEERLNIIAEERQSIFNALPGPIQDMANGAKKFGKALAAGAGPLVIIAAIAVAALKSFTDLDASARSFRDATGMTNTQMEGMRSQANELAGSFGYAGVNAEKVFDTMAALKSEFSDINKFSTEVVGSLTLLNTNFGVSAENAGKVQGIFEQIGGLSSETAASVQMQVAQMANLAGVAPAKVFADIADNAEIASTLFQGDVEALTKAAIQARRLGTNLKSVASTSEHLLDFQSNIGDELVAATFVGGQFSLTQARSLAAAGKHVDAQKEVLRQLQRSGDFRKKDYFTQQQMAKAAGMSVEDINKQLNAQEKLNSLTSDQRKLAEDAISQGLDISNIDKDQLASQVNQFKTQKEMKSQTEALAAAFTGIAATIGSALTPLLEGLMPIIQGIMVPIQLMASAVGYILKGFVDLAPVLLPILAIMTAMYVRTKAVAIMSVIKGAWQGLGGLPVVGPALAVAAILGGVGYINSQKADDYQSTGYGKRTMFSPEGSVAFNDNDTILAGTNLGQGGGGGNDTAAIVAAIRESKDVYMDGRRVTSRVASSVEKSSKNQYGFG